MCIRDRFNTVLAISADPSGEGRDALSARLLGADGVSSVSFTSDLKTSFSGMLQKIDIIVVVLIVAAGLLAYVVLYNLTNINIAERVKEIATIKVLGFYDREVYAYVYRENICLLYTSRAPAGSARPEPSASKRLFARLRVA